MDWLKACRTCAGEDSMEEVEELLVALEAIWVE